MISATDPPPTVPSFKTLQFSLYFLFNVSFSDQAVMPSPSLRLCCCLRTSLMASRGSDFTFVLSCFMPVELKHTRSDEHGFAWKDQDDQNVPKTQAWQTSEWCCLTSAILCLHVLYPHTVHVIPAASDSLSLWLASSPHPMSFIPCLWIKLGLGSVGYKWYLQINIFNIIHVI